MDALGGANRSSLITGPSGIGVEANWALRDGVAIIETALAAGLSLAGGRERNDPWTATTRGVGELIVAAAESGAHTVIISVGGSATTDGGRGALDAVADARCDVREIELVVAADVRTLFVDAAAVFAPQKGADALMVRRLSNRLTALAHSYLTESGVDVTQVSGAGAAGGLAGGLLTLGATIVSGFDLVADRLDLNSALREADLVITGEGSLDSTSLTGKVVGGVVDRARQGGVETSVICGVRVPTLHLDAGVLSLTELFGPAASHDDAAACVERAVVLLIRGQEAQR